MCNHPLRCTSLRMATLEVEACRKYTIYIHPLQCTSLRMATLEVEIYRRYTIYILPLQCTSLRMVTLVVETCRMQSMFTIYFQTATCICRHQLRYSLTPSFYLPPNTRGICSWQSGTGTRFSPSISISLVHKIPSVLHTRISLIHYRRYII